MAKRKVTSRKRATRKSPAARPRATRKSTTKKRTTTKKRVTPKAKAGRKSTAKKRTITRKSVTPKATRKRATTKKRATTRKTVTPKARAARKPVRKVARKRKPVRHKGEFDFNAWLLPRLELEKYELHAEAETGVKDDIKGSTRYAWIGAGQCGGRIVQSFYDLGYRKVLAVNTTHHDLDLLDIPRGQKFLMDIGAKGAGKDMGRGKDAVLQYQQEILHLTRQ
ncbi:MAG: hypothetical protein ACYSYL_17085, partial [Planctomycetota bacterium]